MSSPTLKVSPGNLRTTFSMIASLRIPGTLGQCPRREKQFGSFVKGHSKVTQ
jgi:hypothetical protein